MGPEETAKALIERVKAQTTPGNRSLEIGVFVSRGLQERELSLYEAYLLSGARMELTRLSYVQPAWSNRVHISVLLELLNLRLLAAVFGEAGAEAHWTEYAREAYSMNRERRPHYVLDHYQEYLKETVPSELLQNLCDIRASRSKPFDRGPYHTEVFPYDSCKCEALLLQGKTLPRGNSAVRDVIAGLAAELALLLE